MVEQEKHMARLNNQQCQQLKEQGLHLDTTVEIALQLAFNGPICLKSFSKVVHSTIDCYSIIHTAACCINTVIGRYCTIKDGARLGAVSPEHKSYTLSPAIHGQTFNFANFTSPIKTFFQASPNFDPIQCTDQDFAQIKIGHDVWIGEDVLIAKSVQIGHGAILKAGAVILEDVPPYAIVQGQQEIVGYRYPPDQIDLLLQIQWWNYNIPLLVQQGYRIPLQDIEGVLSFFQSTPAKQLIKQQEQWLTLSIN